MSTPGENQGTASTGARPGMKPRMDLRGLAPPEPMERILDALDALERGQCLEALTPYRPVPLLPILEERGYAWRVDRDEAGNARIRICHATDALLLRAPG